MDQPLVVLAAVAVVGVLAQWLAWRVRVPSILLLLLAGVVAGPVSGLLVPDELVGNEMLMACVSLAVAVILFEGGLSLRWDGIREVRGTVLRMIVVAVPVTWAVGALAARLLLGLPWNVAALAGAILTVSGPTVVGPLLAHVRPVGRVRSILEWEGILNDAFGALLAVLVFEVIAHGHADTATGTMVGGLLRTAVFGGAIGWAGARALLALFRAHLVPDALQSPMTLGVVLTVYVASDRIQHEAGLLAVTVAGIVMANQRAVPVKHVIEFKENLRVLLISTLFLLLAARVTREQLALVDLRALGFLAVMVLVARPLAVEAATMGSAVTRPERTFLAAVAPRGIVAAAVSSVFGLRLEELGVAGGELLAPLVFFVIVGTVVVYGFGAAPVARRLGLARPNPQGVLFIGAQAWARDMAAALAAQGVPVHLLADDRRHVRSARLAGLRATYGGALSDETIDRLDLDDIRHCLAMTSNDELNSLVTLHFIEDLGRANVYQLPPEIEDPEQDGPTASQMRARTLFAPDAAYHEIGDRVALGAAVRRTKITGEFGLEEFRAHYGESARPLFVVDGKGRVTVVTAERPVSAADGDVLIGLVDDPERPLEESEAKAATPSALP